jgi:hypothetical protein
VAGRTLRWAGGRGWRVLALLAAAACHPDLGPAPTDVLVLPAFDGTAFACQDGAVDPPGCAALAQAYADVLPIGLTCDPDASELCNSPRPGLSTSAADGGASSVGVCSCPFYVSPPHSGALDAALARFLQAGCHVRCCPCPAGSPAVRPCRALAPATGTCG